jgi:hypothetical protein
MSCGNTQYTSLEVHDSVLFGNDAPANFSPPPRPFASFLITSFLNSCPMLITAFITDRRSMFLQVAEGFIEIIT